jgi:predicted MFS family arabinose efflux permease
MARTPSRQSGLKEVNDMPNNADSQSRAGEGGNASQLRSWLAVFSVSLTATVFCTTEFLPVGVLRYISEGLDVSEGTAGLMVTAPGILAAFAASGVTIAVGNQDRRHVLWGLGLLLIASNFIAMLAPSFPILILGRVLFGIGLGGFWAIGASLGSRLVEERSAAKATSIIFAGVSIGMLIGGPAGAFLGNLLGWRSTFGIALVLSIVAFAAQLVLLPPLHVAQSVRPRDILGIAATRKGRVGLIAMLLVLSGQFGTYTYITPFLANVSGFSGTSISSILFGYTLVGLVGNFIGGMAAGRNEKAALLSAIVFILLPVALLPSLGGSQPWTVALLVVWGLAFGAMPIALQMWMIRAAPNLAEGGMALFVTNFQVAIALGSFVGGAVLDSFDIGDAMYLGGVLALAAAMTITLSGGRAAILEPQAAP